VSHDEEKTLEVGDDGIETKALPLIAGQQEAEFRIRSS
jgi:hypothetical protein